MKFGKSFKLITLCAFLLVTVLFSSFAVSAEEYVAEENLPHVSRWLNGTAISSYGGALNDTWAVDDTDVSDKKYVLIDQESVEIMRVGKYPEGISSGDTSVCPTYNVSVSLSLPGKVSGMVDVTVENDDAEYTLSFSEENAYKCSVKVLPGIYKVSGVEVYNDLDGDYLFKNSLRLTVSNKDVVAVWQLLDGDNSSGDSESVAKTDADGNEIPEPSDSSSDDDKSSFIKSTIFFFGLFVLLCIVYGVYKYRFNNLNKEDK